MADQYRKLEGRSLEFGLDAEGHVSEVTGLEGVVQDPIRAGQRSRMARKYFRRRAISEEGNCHRREMAFRRAGSGRAAARNSVARGFDVSYATNRAATAGKPAPGSRRRDARPRQRRSAARSGRRGRVRCLRRNFDAIQNSAGESARRSDSGGLSSQWSAHFGSLDWLRREHEFCFAANGLRGQRHANRRSGSEFHDCERELNFAKLNYTGKREKPVADHPTAILPIKN